jgi:hypothetical protein
MPCTRYARIPNKPLLEVRAREAEVPTLPEIKAPYPLREAALHARPQSILASPENRRNSVRWGSLSLFYETNTLMNLCF